MGIKQGLERMTNETETSEGIWQAVGKRIINVVEVAMAAVG